MYLPVFLTGAVISLIGLMLKPEQSEPQTEKIVPAEKLPEPGDDTPIIVENVEGEKA